MPGACIQQQLEILRRNTGQYGSCTPCRQSAVEPARHLHTFLCEREHIAFRFGQHERLDKLAHGSLWCALRLENKSLKRHRLDHGPCSALFLRQGKELRQDSLRFSALPCCQLHTSQDTILALTSRIQRIVCRLLLKFLRPGQSRLHIAAPYLKQPL